jgi:hypothetical protein
MDYVTHLCEFAALSIIRSFCLPSPRDIEAVIFVVDSSDKLRMSVAQEELKTLLTHRSEYETL